MSNIVNAISYFEGRVTWLGEVKSGQGNNGNPWIMQTFVLTWQDSKFEPQHIVLTASGDDRVRKIQEYAQSGQLVRVLWRPDAREYQGKWFGENRLLNIGLAQVPAQGAAPAPGQPTGGYPGMQQPAAPYAGLYQQRPAQPQAQFQPAPQYQQQAAPAPAPVIDPTQARGFDEDIPDFLQ